MYSYIYNMYIYICICIYMYNSNIQKYWGQMYGKLLQSGSETYGKSHPSDPVWWFTYTHSI